MTRLRHPFWALSLALSLFAMGQAIASARVMAGASGQIEICTGTGPVMVFVDGDGQPTAPPRYCPDGALALFDGMAMVAALPVTPGAAAPDGYRLRAWLAPSVPLGAAPARGPPLG